MGISIGLNGLNLILISEVSVTIDDQMNCDTFARYPLYTYDEVAISYYGDHLEEECAVRIYEDFNHGRICLTIDTLDIYDCSNIVKLYGGSHIGKPDVVILHSFLSYIHISFLLSLCPSILSSFFLPISHFLLPFALPSYLSIFVHQVHRLLVLLPSFFITSLPLFSFIT